MKLPHTAAPYRKRVYVKLRDGTRFVDRFLDRTDRQVQFEQHGWIDKRNIASFAIYRDNERSNEKQ